jgi:MOSC domain-containing protein YiiM
MIDSAFINRPDDASEAKITGIFISSGKGMDQLLLSEAVLVADYGISGDAHAGHPTRQVTLLSDKCRKLIDSSENKGLCVKRFNANIMFDGLSLPGCAAGTQFSIGRCRLEITGIGKRCFPECVLVQNSQHCCLKNEVIFARVITGGLIRTGDEIFPDDMVSRLP